MLLTCQQVAQRTGLKEGTIRRWILLRRIPFVHIGRAVRIRETDLEAIIQEGYTPATTSGTMRR
jgi:excisionase family DNA binding protein